jgi:hypothetical protein
MAFLLVAPSATNASEGPQTEPNTSTEEGKRPVWLRQIEDETNSGSRHGGGPGDEKIAGLRPGWSEFEPGVLDVQAWDWLQQDLDRMLDGTRAHALNRPSPEEFEAKFMSATAKFLEFDTGESKAFQSAVHRALDEIGRARTNMLRKPKQPDLDETAAMLASRTGWTEYGRAQHHAVRHPLAVLRAQPRHGLLREDMLKWLLHLDYGIGAAAK